MLHPTTHPPLRRAFSLVEILVVVTIIGLLIAIIVPSLNGIRNSAAKASTSATLGAIRLGLAQYESQFNIFPPSAGGGDHMLAMALQGPAGKGFQTRSNTAMGGPIGTVYGPYGPTDPKSFNGSAFIDSWGHPILYYRAALPTPATITAVFGTDNKCYFNSADCPGNPAAAPAAFFALLGAAANTNPGPITGASSYLLISGGPDEIYFTADDVIVSK